MNLDRPIGNESSNCEHQQARRRLLEDYLRIMEAPAEAAFSEAREADRRALAAGLSMEDIAAVHHQGMVDVLTRGSLERDRERSAQTAAALCGCCPRGGTRAPAPRLLEEIREEEARRIAHALHDQAAQFVAAAQLEVDELAHSLAIPDSRLSRLRARLDEIAEQLRCLSHELRPSLLDDFGLAPALELLAEHVSRRTGVRISLAGMSAVRLPSIVETTLYRMVQEAFTNAVRHGCARSIGVSIERSAAAVICTVRDDGSGFDTHRLQHQGHRGLGLVGIRERVQALGGTMRLTSGCGGTEILVRVPLASVRAAATAQAV